MVARILCATFLMLGVIFSASAQINHKIDPAFQMYQDKGGPLPEMQIKTLQGKYLTNSDLKSENNLFLIVFNPGCGHCEKTADLVSDYAYLFSKSKVVFLSYPVEQTEMDEFYNKTKLGKHPEFIIGMDQIFAIDKIANYGMLPMINVYDKDQKLIKTLNGSVTIEKLKEFLPK